MRGFRRCNDRRRPRRKTQQRRKITLQSDLNARVTLRRGQHKPIHQSPKRFLRSGHLCASPQTRNQRRHPLAVGWPAHVDQTLCTPETIYADPEALWGAQDTRGPIAAFFSQDEIIPRINTVGVARVADTSGHPEGLPVYAAARPSAATPIWWMLQPGDTVDIIDRENDFVAVAIPTLGLAGCFLRPEALGQPYNGPCATGWVDGAYLQQIQ